VGIVDSLIPAAGRADTAALSAVDADDLARYVIDPAHRWWRRKPCVTALTGRVPAARVPALIARIRDSTDTGEVRIALLDLLGDRVELLPWLQQQNPGTETSYGVFEAILKARGRLGDRSAAAELATLANDPWPHRRTMGEAGMDALAARYGADAVLADLGDARPEDRAFRLRVRHRSGADVTDALADPDVGVAHLAHTLIDDEKALRAYLDRAPTVDATLWAALALYRRNPDRAGIRALYDSLGRPRIEVDGLDDEIRGAILRHYAPGSTARTDPRWRIEAILVEAPLPPDEEDQLRRAGAALASAGLAPAPPVSCGDHHHQGDGTYFVIEYTGGTVFTSTLGPFVAADDADDDARSALEAAGFRWIDETLGAVRVAGLCVYYFGSREPLDVRTLLFYWQD
jgi:hypothetical protein